MKISVRPRPKMGCYQYRNWLKDETKFEFKFTETTGRTREKDFWLKMWRIRQDITFFLKEMSTVVQGYGVVSVTIPKNTSEKKLKELIQAIEAVKLWEN